MKKPFWVTPVIFLFIACEFNQKSTQLSLNIQNAPANSIIIFDGYNPDTVSLSDGKAIVPIKIKKSTFIELHLLGKQERIYIEPGKNMSVSWDGENLENSFLLTGDLAMENITLKALTDSVITRKKKVRKACVDTFSIFKENFMDHEIQAQRQWVNIYEDSVSKHFAAIMNERVNMLDVEMALLYDRYHPRQAKDTAYETPQAIQNLIDKLDINNDQLLGLKEYEDLVSDAIEFEVDKEEMDLDKFYQYSHKKIEAVEKMIQNPNVREQLVFISLKSQLMYEGVIGVESHLENFYQGARDKRREKALKRYAAPWKKVEKGMKAVELVVNDMQGKEVKLSDFKGKYVYIDFWATWCGPCKAEIPYLEKLQEDFQGENIAFLSISVDKTTKPWKKMVEEKEMHGHQLHQGASGDVIKKDYVVHSIPRFVIIDPNGLIISGNAERPSGKAAEVLRGLLAGGELSVNT